MLRFIFLIVIVLTLIGSQYSLPTHSNVPKSHQATSFTYPVGKNNSTSGYYDAQSFGRNRHLGEDWNGNGGGNSDLGLPIKAIANGYVSVARYHPFRWGNIIRIIHYTPDGKQVESIYAHCNTMEVSQGEFVKKGQTIGTIGNSNGRYLAHLHFEIRDDINMRIGIGYSKNKSGYVNPTKFIEERQ